MPSLAVSAVAALGIEGQAPPLPPLHLLAAITVSQLSQDCASRPALFRHVHV
jgi:hypothetical protein